MPLTPEQKLTLERINKRQECYCFNIARRTLDWAEAEYTEEELADLVMQELLNIKY